MFEQLARPSGPGSLRHGRTRNDDVTRQLTDPIAAKISSTKWQLHAQPHEPVDGNNFPYFIADLNHPSLSSTSSGHKRFCKNETLSVFRVFEKFYSKVKTIMSCASPFRRETISMFRVS
nr:uncharacterized protein LOC123745441 [Procambarus clarkii]